MKCVRTLVSGCVFSVGTGIVCLFLVSADVIYGIVRAASHKERQLPCQTRLLLPCPAPGRHPASPSHFNYGWHCLKTRRGRGHTRVFIEKPTHTLPKKGFTVQKLFPAEARIYLRDALTEQVGKKSLTLTRPLNTSFA